MVKHAHETNGQPVNTVTEVTHRAIIDYLSVGRHWSGGFQEDGFLGRFYDLKQPKYNA